MRDQELLAHLRDLIIIVEIDTSLVILSQIHAIKESQPALALVARAAPDHQEAVVDLEGRQLAALFKDDLVL